ncbi:MAG: hypothetical protein H7A00_07465 [Hahellaceae bacterium]|nr:hypothetical protein [Hahellaceae bacterium]
MRLIKGIIAILLIASQSVPALAMPTFARQYKQQYGYMPSCNACHTEGGGTTLNPFGKAFKDHGKNLSAFEKIASADSDADGTTNLAEAQAKANPGDPKSTPAAPGEWLDMASLIPKEVRALFPTITTWMPLDAVFTAKDFATAETLGATLTAEDETTIYVPVENRRPNGTALIFPVQFSDKTFFLVMATDRQLQIREINVLHAKDVPDAEDPQLYSRFAGQSLQALEVQSGDSLSARISQAVKKAVVLLYVRLKGA